MEYSFSDGVRGSVGFHRGDPGSDSGSYPILGPKMPFYGVSFTGMVEPVKDLAINSGISRFFYEDAENDEGIKIFKEIWLVAFGVQARLY